MYFHYDLNWVKQEPTYPFTYNRVQGENARNTEITNNLEIKKVTFDPIPAGVLENQDMLEGGQFDLPL